MLCKESWNIILIYFWTKLSISKFKFTSFFDHWTQHLIRRLACWIEIEATIFNRRSRRREERSREIEKLFVRNGSFIWLFDTNRRLNMHNLNCLLWKYLNFVHKLSSLGRDAGSLTSALLQDRRVNNDSVQFIPCLQNALLNNSFQAIHSFYALLRNSSRKNLAL